MGLPALFLTILTMVALLGVSCLAKWRGVKAERAVKAQHIQTFRQLATPIGDDGSIRVMHYSGCRFVVGPSYAQEGGLIVDFYRDGSMIDSHRVASLDAAFDHMYEYGNRVMRGKEAAVELKTFRDSL